MKNLKKVLAFVVVFAMMFTMAVSASSFKDVADDASYAEAVTILNALGLMIGDNEGNFNPDQSITRAEAATVIVRAKGLDNAAAGAVGTTAFTDVPADHWASGYINIATQSGIVAGYGDGTFGPSNPVTYEQMVKLIVAALGYTPKAEANGGYPTGYLVIASQKNITKGATGNAGDAAPRKTVARLIYNALDVNMMEQTVFTKDSEEFKECNPPRYLLHDLGVSKYEGDITGTYASKGNADKETIDMKYTSQKNGFDGYASTSGGNIIFDSFGKTNAADYLGYNVTVYAELDDATDEMVILAVAPKSGKNDVVELDYADINKVDFVDKTETDTEKLVPIEIEYGDDDDDLDISKNATYFWNGQENAKLAKAFLKAIADDAVTTGGKVKFLSTGTDSDDYNFVFVTEYTDDFLVDEVNASRMTATDKDGNYKVDFDKDGVIYTIYKDGELATFDDIKVGDVLTLAKSSKSNASLITVYISSKSVTGTVSEKTNESDAYYKIDGNLYRKSLINGPASIATGDSGTFYLNVDNRIVAKDTSTGSTAGTYAYVIKIKKITDDEKVQIKYLTADGKFEQKDLASKLIMHKGNDEEKAIDPYKESNDSFNALFDGTNAIKQLIKFTTNSAGEVKNIYLAANGKDDDNFSLDKDDTAASYKASSKKLGKVFVEDNTLVFRVPEDPSTTSDEKDFYISNARATFNEDDTFKYEAFDMDGDYPSVIVVYGGEAIIDSSTRVLVITSVAKGRNANDIPVDKFYGYQEGVSVSADASEDGVDYYDVKGKAMTNAPELKAGDAVIFNLDGAGNIDKIQVLFTADKAKALGTTAWYSDEDDFAKEEVINAFGVANQKASGGNLTVDLKGTAAKDDVFTVKGTYNVYEVNINRSTPTVSVSDYASIDVAKTIYNGENMDQVYIRQYDGDVYDIVVYRSTFKGTEYSRE